MRYLGLSALIASACGATTASSVPANTSAREDAPATSGDAWCRRPATATQPLARDELEASGVPRDERAARDELTGIWDGYVFELDGELGQPGVRAVVKTAETLCFTANGRLIMLSDDENDSRSGCTPRVRTYSVQNAPDANNALLARVRSEGGCPGDASYGKPYSSSFELHRLDDHVLVLMDGSTGAVKGYRRR